MVKLEVGLHHRCLGSNYRSLGVVKLVMGLHQGSSSVVKLKVGLHQGCYIREHEISRVVNLVMGLHYRRCKKVKFIMELHHKSPKEREANVGASP